MRRMLTFALVLFMALPATTLLAFGQATGSLAGTASSSSGQGMANATVHLRNASTGQLAGTTTTNGAGAYSFTGLPAGQYVVEVVNGSGEIVATSTPVSLAAGSNITGINVMTPAGTMTTGHGSWFTSTAGIVTMVAAGAAVAGVTVAANRSNASASK